MIRIMLVDEHPMVRRGLRMRLGLEPDLEIVGEAGNGREALWLVQSLALDVMVVDVVTSDLDGIAITGHARELAPRTAMAVLSLHGDSATQALARWAGAAECGRNGQGRGSADRDPPRSRFGELTPTLVGGTAHPKVGENNPSSAR